MAITETMSNYSDWMQLYQNNFPTNQIQTPATTATATDTSAAIYSASARNTNLIPDHGRVSKPARRRSRASRQTPTTLLNTDITNFRAMVQHFTGGPAARQHLPGGAGGSPAGGFSAQYANKLTSLGQGQGSGGVSAHAPPPVSEDRDCDGYVL